MVRMTLIGLIALTATGCSTIPSHEAPSAVVPVEHLTQPSITFNRDKNWSGGACTIALNVDGVQVATIDNGETIRIENVEKGPRVVQMETIGFCESHQRAMVVDVTEHHVGIRIGFVYGGNVLFHRTN